MDRGRSPTSGEAHAHAHAQAQAQAQTQHIRLSTSASPHPLHYSDESPFQGLNQHATSGAFGDTTLSQHSFAGSDACGYQQSQQQEQYAFNEHSISAPTNAFPSFDLSNGDFDLLSNSAFDQTASLDPSVLSDLDSSSIGLLTPGTDFSGAPFDPMAATMQQPLQGASPHLMDEMARGPSGSPSPHASPRFQAASFLQNMNMSRARGVSESLDPSSAMYPQGQHGEWTGMGGYRSHKRSPSDNFSDISSNHQNSPYIGTLDSFDVPGHSSPLLSSSQDPTFNDGLGLQQFSLSEIQPFNHSPGHSPGHSPRMMPQPQHALPPFTAENNFGLNANINVFNNEQRNDLDMFSSIGQEPFPPLNTQRSSPGADHMSPPEINIDYAPPTRPADHMNRAGSSQDALSPPARSMLPAQDLRHVRLANPAAAPNRARAKSDSHAGSRSPSPALRGRSPSLQPQPGSENLSPFDNTNSRPESRSSSQSPARGRSGSLNNRSRSHSNSSDQRDYILDLADPKRTPSNGAESKRQQKHPATFQCTLCPKRFTRAYNLRSHLRTHTDERPFVCTVCGKAFARQHDRKRHEGLHSGEKRFVCRGTLQGGMSWGCGRRFARADALGRHFRSEAGRVCIKPLLDEEAADRQKAWMEQQQQEAQVTAGLVAPQPIMQQPQVDLLANLFPAALLQQYPALAGIDWSSLPQGPPPDDEVYGGRSSFDASDYDPSEGEISTYNDQSMSGMGNNPPLGGMQSQNPQGFFQHNGTGDYLSDFDGR